MSAPDEQPQALPPELAQLEGLALAADATLNAADAPPAPPGAEPRDLAAEGAGLGAMLQAVMTMAEPVAPYLPRAYTPEVCDRIGLAVAAVAEKRGWDMTKLASPEVMLAFVTIPPTIAAVKLGREYFAWQERQQQRQQQSQPEPDLAAVDGS